LREDLGHRVTRVQAVIGVLKDHLDAAQLLGAPPLDAARQGRAIAKRDLAARGGQQTGYGSEDRRFAAAGFAHQPECLALRQRQFDAVDRGRWAR